MSFSRVYRFLYGMIDIFWKGFAAAFDILLPRICCVCGRRLLKGERHLCMGCRLEMPLTHFWDMTHNPMADRFNCLIQKWLDERDSSQPEIREPYAFAAALFYFREDDRYKEIPYRIKYQGDIPAGIHFGRMLGKRLAGSEIWKGADVVIPVPLHWTRQWKRGYNQAEAIASGLAEALGAQLRPDILIRYRRTETQTILEGPEKAANVAGAFRGNLHKIPQDSLSGIRHLIIVDDVFTTGSTLMACFTALRSVFPPGVRISVATLGFVGGG